MADETSNSHEFYDALLRATEVLNPMTMTAFENFAKLMLERLMVKQTQHGVTWTKDTSENMVLRSLTSEDVIDRANWLMFALALDALSVGTFMQMMPKDYADQPTLAFIETHEQLATYTEQGTFEPVRGYRFPYKDD